MAYVGTILALDVATKTGWALGKPSDTPRSGSLRFAREGASMAAVFTGCRKWLLDFVAVNRPDLVVFEAPIAPATVHGFTNITTIRTLVGLAAIVEEALYGRGIDVREAAVGKVRQHFIGTTRLKSSEAKQTTKQMCRTLGWSPCDDNAADALALWSYQCAVLVPELAIRTSPLWRAG